METKKLIGIISSILIIFFYLGVVVIELIFKGNHSVVEFYQTVGSLIFTISFIGFYYALIKYFNKSDYRIEIRILNTLNIFIIVTFIINGIQHYYGVIPSIIPVIIFISAIILFVLFGIRILKRQDRNFMNLKALKWFVVSMFIIYGLILALAILLTFNHQENLLNVMFSIYGIPYILGLRFFLKDNKKYSNQ